MVLYQQLYQVHSVEVSGIGQRMSTTLQDINGVVMTTTTIIITIYTTDLITDVWVHSLLQEVRKQVHINSIAVVAELKERLLKVGLSIQQNIKTHCHS